MSWIQDILNASVSVNRCVWAVNEHDPGALDPRSTSPIWKNDKERLDYIKHEIGEAISDLSKANTKLNQII